MEVIMVHRHIIYTKFSAWRFKIKDACGSYLWDDKGKQYIDFTSGWNVTNLGWNRPEIAEAVSSQVMKNTYASMWFCDDLQEKYASALHHVLPKELDSCSRVTGGVEANEHAMKLARAYTGRKKILGFYETYHGNNLSMLEVGYRKEWLTSISSDNSDYIHLEYPNIYRTDLNETEVLHDFEKRLEAVLENEDVAAVFAESGIISGWGSAYVAPTGFLTVVRRLTEKYGTLLILDEVGTGFSRTGKLFGMKHENIVPDIVTFAKGMSNGVAPIGAMVTKEKIAEVADPANLQSTFGWLPISCAAALETLKIHEKEKIWERVQKTGHYMMGELKKHLQDHPNVGDIRGMGMILGLDFVKDKKTKQKYPELTEKIVLHAWKKGLHLVCDHESVIQLMPPLTIEKEVLDKGIKVLVNVIK